MLSRVANAIYWMSRYVERAANIARFIEVNWYLMLDLPTETREQWKPLVDVTGDGDVFKEKYKTPTREHVISFLTFETSYAHSVISCIQSARENALAVRDRISPEMWEHMNALYHLLTDASKNAYRHNENPEFYNQIKIAGMLMGGIAHDTMNHDEGWHFFRLRRQLERADKTSRMLDVKYFILLPSIDYVGTPYDDVQWAAPPICKWSRKLSATIRTHCSRSHCTNASFRSNVPPFRSELSDRHGKFSTGYIKHAYRNVPK